MTRSRKPKVNRERTFLMLRLKCQDGHRVPGSVIYQDIENQELWVITDELTRIDSPDGSFKVKAPCLACRRDGDFRDLQVSADRLIAERDAAWASGVRDVHEISAGR